MGHLVPALVPARLGLIIRVSGHSHLFRGAFLATQLLSIHCPFSHAYRAGPHWARPPVHLPSPLPALLETVLSSNFTQSANAPEF